MSYEKTQEKQKGVCREKNCPSRVAITLANKVRLIHCLAIGKTFEAEDYPVECSIAGIKKA